MNSRERSVVDAVYSLNGDPREPEPRERFNPMLAIRNGITARRYRRQLDLIAEQRASSIVQQRLDGGDFAQSVDALVAGLLHDFPSGTQTVVRQRSQALESHIREVAETVARELADQIAVRNFQVQHLRDEIFDKRETLQRAQIELVILPPEEPASPKRLFGTEQSLAVAYTNLGRLRAALVLAAAQIAAVFSLETILTYFFLAPVLTGTAVIAGWMIAAQAIVLSSVLLFLGHLLWSRNIGLRWLAAIALTALTVVIAVIRAGVVTYSAGGAGGAETQDSMALTVIGLMALSGLGLAVIGGQAFHRAQETARKSSRFWSRKGGDIAEMEAEVAEWNAARAHHRNREEELTRLVPRLEQDISRLESRLQSYTAETRELVQRSIREAVNRRLSPEIRNMAQQLARWKHDPDSAKKNSTVRGLLTAAVTLSLTVFAGSACTPRAPEVHHILLDNSGSVSSDVAERMRARVLQEVQNWIKTANPEDEFAVWWLTKEGSAYPAAYKALKMPPLQIPAYASRQAFANETMSKIENWLDELPHGVQKTRLLEAIYFIGSTEDLPWSLTILSDLREDSRSWDSIQAAGSKDSGLVKSMLELCPTVRVPPVTVSLVSWPGLINGSGGIKEHQDARRLFMQFFKQWAPDAEVSVMSM